MVEKLSTSHQQRWGLYNGYYIMLSVWLVCEYTQDNITRQRPLWYFLRFLQFLSEFILAFSASNRSYSGCLNYYQTHLTFLEF